jgi:hypothetical protein
MNTRGNTHASPPSHRQAAVRRPARTSCAAAPAREDASATPSPQHRRGWNTPRIEDPALMRILIKEANRRGHQLQEMAQALGCTYGYISQLRSGIRQTEHIGQEFAEHAARYLGVPTALVKLMSGRVTIKDFLWPQRDPQQDIADCLDALRDDPVVGSYVPKELYDAAHEVKQFVWQLYTECSDLHPTPSRALPRMLEYLQRAALEEAEYEMELADLRESMGQPGAQVKELS